MKKRTKKFALDVIKLCCGLPQMLEARHAIGQIIRSSSSGCELPVRLPREIKADFISKLGTVEEEADESGFWLEMLRDILNFELRMTNSECQVGCETRTSAIATRHSDFAGTGPA